MNTTHLYVIKDSDGTLTSAEGLEWTRWELYLWTVARILKNRFQSVNYHVGVSKGLDFDFSFQGPSLDRNLNDVHADVFADHNPYAYVDRAANQMCRHFADDAVLEFHLQLTIDTNERDTHIDVNVVDVGVRQTRANACRQTSMAFLKCLTQRKMLLWDLRVIVTKFLWTTRRDEVWDPVRTE